LTHGNISQKNIDGDDDQMRMQLFVHKKEKNVILNSAKLE